VSRGRIKKDTGGRGHLQCFAANVCARGLRRRRRSSAEWFAPSVRIVVCRSRGLRRFARRAAVWGGPTREGAVATERRAFRFAVRVRRRGTPPRWRSGRRGGVNVRKEVDQGEGKAQRMGPRSTSAKGCGAGPPVPAAREAVPTPTGQRPPGRGKSGERSRAARRGKGRCVDVFNVCRGSASLNVAPEPSRSFGRRVFSTWRAVRSDELRCRCNCLMCTMHPYREPPLAKGGQSRFAAPRLRPSGRAGSPPVASVSAARRCSGVCGPGEGASWRRGLGRRKEVGRPGGARLGARGRLG
jgi:hypothetical protein